MCGFLLALAVVGGLVRAAATRPDRLASLNEDRLVKLRRTLEAGELSLELAEDGAVLARRARQPEVEKEFKKYVAELKTKRKNDHGT